MLKNFILLALLATASVSHAFTAPSGDDRPYWLQIYEAAFAGDFNRVRMLLAVPPPQPKPLEDADGVLLYTFFRITLEAERPRDLLEMSERLIALGARPGPMPATEEPWTATELMLAVWSGELRGATPNQKQKIQTRAEAFFDLLLDHQLFHVDGSVRIPDRLAPHHYPLVHWAPITRSPREIMRYFLSRGASPSGLDQFGFSLLQNLARLGDVESLSDVEEAIGSAALARSFQFMLPLQCEAPETFLAMLSPLVGRSVDEAWTMMRALADRGALTQRASDYAGAAAGYAQMYADYRTEFLELSSRLRTHGDELDRIYARGKARRSCVEALRH